MKMRYTFKEGAGKHRDFELGLLAPGQSVIREPWEMAHVLDKFVTSPADSPDEPQGQAQLALLVTQRSPGWFDVVDQRTGKPINEIAMRKQDALLLAGLRADPTLESEEPDQDDDSEDDEEEGNDEGDEGDEPENL